MTLVIRRMPMQVYEPIFRTVVLLYKISLKNVVCDLARVSGRRVGPGRKNRNLRGIGPISFIF